MEALLTAVHLCLFERLVILKRADTAKLFAADQAMFELDGDIGQGSELIAAGG
ncbi:hypothetical protein [Pedobacter hiemivivus]|uniref:hypothetical protein n=1 Tax=Pedobacter hiemivivus TaxID=2530454 RepID=UPI00146DBAD7|nr:hypothetical protein [Pedobacter hiemivivus]